MIPHWLLVVLAWAVIVTGALGVLAGCLYVASVATAIGLKQTRAFWMFVKFVQWKHGEGDEPSREQDPNPTDSADGAKE